MGRQGGIRIYWSVKSLPELQGLSEEERRSALRGAHRRAIHDRRTIRSWAITVLAVAVGASLLSGLLYWAGLSGVLRHVWTVGVGLAGGFCLVQPYMAGVARALREEQQAHAPDPTDGR